MFNDSDLISDLFMKRITVDVAHLSYDGITQEEKTLIMKRRYIMLYNRHREVLDLWNPEEKLAL